MAKGSMLFAVVFGVLHCHCATVPSNSSQFVFFFHLILRKRRRAMNEPDEEPIFARNIEVLHKMWERKQHLYRNHFPFCKQQRLQPRQNLPQDTNGFCPKEKGSFPPTKS